MVLDHKYNNYKLVLYKKEGQNIYQYHNHMVDQHLDGEDILNMVSVADGEDILVFKWVDGEVNQVTDMEWEVMVLQWLVFKWEWVVMVFQWEWVVFNMVLQWVMFNMVCQQWVVIQCKLYNLNKFNNRILIRINKKTKKNPNDYAFLQLLN